MVVILFGDLASGLEMAGSICSYWHDIKVTWI